MKRSHIFLFISIIGICYTWFYNIQYFMSYEDASLVHFFELAQSNFAGKSFGADLSVVVLTFFVWFIPDARNKGLVGNHSAHFFNCCGLFFSFLFIFERKSFRKKSIKVPISFVQRSLAYSWVIN